MRYRNNFDLVREFHETFDVPINAPITSKLTRLRMNLIDEECYEVAEELDPPQYNEEIISIDKEKLTKELADLLYVTYGTAVTFGLPIDEAFLLVHESNMSKLDKDGKVLRREDGKVLKSDQYKPADLSVLFK